MISDEKVHTLFEFGNAFRNIICAYYRGVWYLSDDVRVDVTIYVCINACMYVCIKYYMIEEEIPF